MQKFKMAAEISLKNEHMTTFQAKYSAEITQSQTISKTNAFFHFMQIFKMTLKNDFGEMGTCFHIPFEPNFGRNALSHTVSKINALM